MKKLKLNKPLKNMTLEEVKSYCSMLYDANCDKCEICVICPDYGNPPCNWELDEKEGE